MRATNFTASYKMCSVHYQPVVDCIVSHPDERNEIVRTLSYFVENGGYNQIGLVQFLMEWLKWPEIKAAAQARCEWEGNMYHEVKHLIDVL